MTPGYSGSTHIGSFAQEHNLLVQTARYLGMFEKVKNQAEPRGGRYTGM